MIDRDPTTEPAGELIAAQHLVDLLLWIDEGGEERGDHLTGSLLSWKGSRLRDAIAQPALTHLLARVDALTSDTPSDALERLAVAAGLALSTSGLDQFIRRWLEHQAEDSEARLHRLRALDGLVRLLPQRRDHDLTAAARLLLTHRAILAVDPPGPDLVPPHVHTDALLADWLYQHAGRQEAIAADLRQWFIQNAEYPWPSKLRVLRNAALLGHTDVVRAFFEAGSPGPAPGAPGPAIADSAIRLVLDRLADLHPDTLQHVAHHLARRTRKQPERAPLLVPWIIELARRAEQRGDADPAAAALPLFAPLLGFAHTLPLDEALRADLIAALKLPPNP